ncbi:FUSC family protein [Capnocytophaga sp. ARDL2]|uniref:FUSC family protein n=1 Tax=Capnocytophaga sp. ARDL2 TaxID=3238809 RepID=UPI00355627B5
MKTATQLLVKIVYSQLAVYLIRCLIGFLLGYFLMLKFPKYELFWLLLSIILVISPEEKDSRRLTFERVKSNFIGSCVGTVIYMIHDKSVLLLCIGIVITAIVCYLFKVMNMARVAIVSFLIVMLQSHVSEEVLTPLIRFSTVAIGCLIGLSITVLSSHFIRKIKKKYPLEGDV